MAIEVVMPRLGWQMEVGSLVEWVKHDGDQVSPGEVVCTIQSDKAINELESLDSGILRIPPDSPPPGEEVSVGTILAYLIEPGEPVPFAESREGPHPLTPSPLRWRGGTAEPGAPGSLPRRMGETVGPGAPVSLPRGQVGTSEPGAPGSPPQWEGDAIGPGTPDSGPQQVQVQRFAPAAQGTRELGSRGLESAGGAPVREAVVPLFTLYRRMLLIRRCEEVLARAYQVGLVHGACHTYVGEEAIAVGVCAHLRRSDVVVSTHRGHGHALAKGVSPRALVAELFGRATGCCGGRGGSMHLFAPEIGMLGTTGIVGPGILMATGAAYGFALQRTGQVAVAFFGDGAVNNGAFHEGVNMASVWRLPVVFVCENNQYATEVPFVTVAGNPSIAARASTYGLPGAQVDGNDVSAVHQAAGEAVRRARVGEGPTLLECLTYRTRPHAEGMRDTGFGYRTREDVEEWRGRCPIQRLRTRLLAEGLVRESDVERVEAEVRAMVEDAVEFAKTSPWPDPATVSDHVYSE